MRYKWVKENEVVLDVENNTTVPVTNGTAAAIEFAAWLAAGNTPDAADPEPIAATYIPKLVIVDRLIVLNKLADALTALNSDATKKARWDAATEIAVDDADVIAVLTAIGITDTSTILY